MNQQQKLSEEAGNLKIDEEIASLLTDLTEWEYENLKQDIKKRGIMAPLIVSTDSTIVCGHNRYKIAKELKIPDNKIPYTKVEFKTRQEMIDYAINDNLCRRNLNLYQKALVGLRLLPAYKIEAKKRIEESWKKRCPKTKEEVDKNAPQNFGSVSGEAMKLVADKVGVSHETLRKVQKILNSEFIDDLDQALLLKNETSISAIYANIKDHERKSLKAKNKRYTLSTEVAFDTPDVKIFKTLLDRFDLMGDLTTTESEKEESIFITDRYNCMGIYAENEYAKKCLAPFADIHTGEKTKTAKYKLKGVNWDKIPGELVQSKFWVRDLSYILELLKKLDEHEVDFKCKSNGPIEISTENFIFTISPIRDKS